MLFDDVLDIIEDDIQNYEESLLKILLFDRTTRKNILWCTDNYINYGESFAPDCEIKVELITGEYSKLIQPRIAKAIETQDIRTKERAEVFTPPWVCNKQNNAVDDAWFGRKEVFNTQSDATWTSTNIPIQFDKTGNKTWKKYVDAKRLEITCGEAPYLVSRYDTVSGNTIKIKDRVGILDRKLRIVSENTDNEKDWILWAKRAYQSTYGYEYQGDSLLLARENLLITYIDYYFEKFKKNPEKKELMEIARVISWNLWQMDGLKYVVPYSCKPVEEEEITLFGIQLKERPCPGCERDNAFNHTGIYCKVFDWRENASQLFVSMMKGYIDE